MKSSTEVSEVARAPRQAVWELWSDVSTWPSWDAGVEDVAIDGPFEAGTTGRLKPAGGPTVRFVMTSASVDHEFTDETRLLLARMRFSHWLSDAPDGTLVTHRVEIAGPLAPLWGRVIGRGIARELPSSVRALAARAA